MVSRKTASILGEIYQIIFSFQERRGHVNREYTATEVAREQLYDFLFEHEYAAWFCNKAKRLGINEDDRRAVKEWVMKIHTGETVADATADWTWKQREQLGQRFLYDLSKDLLNYCNESPDLYKWPKIKDKVAEFQRLLELDGYLYRNKDLLFSESAVLDVEEETGILQSLFSGLSLNNKETFVHHLELSQENYVIGHWNDVITNSRNALECVLKEICAAHYLKFNKTPVSNSIYTRPVDARNYLEQAGLLEHKEKEALASIYGLLSNTGSHPYIAESDQARLMRHLSLTFSQFVMLRYQGAINNSNP